MKTGWARIPGALFLGACLAILPACGGSPQDGASDKNDIANGPQGAQTSSTLTYLSTTTYPPGAQTANGYYFLQYGTEDGILAKGTASQNIMYIDYASQKCIYLCNSPGCSHDDETCTSFIDATDSAMNIYSAGDKLLLFCTGFVPYEDDTAEAVLPHIDTMDQNGQNRRTLATFKSGQYVDSSNLVCDGEAIYVNVSTTIETGQTEDVTDETGQVVDSWPMFETRNQYTRISLADGACTDLFAMNETNGYQCGILGDGILMQEWTDASGSAQNEELEKLYQQLQELEQANDFDYEKLDADAEYIKLNEEVMRLQEAQYGESTGGLYTLSLPDGTRTDIKEWKNADIEQYSIFGGIMYYFNKQNGDVMALDLLTGEERTLTDKIDFGDDYAYFSHVYGGRLLVEGSRYDEQGEYLGTNRYAVDVNTGEVSELTLACTLQNESGEPISLDGAPPTLVEIVAECGDSLLIVNKYIYSGDVSNLSSGKGFAGSGESRPIFALIKQSDFWSNNNTFEPVESVD